MRTIRVDEAEYNTFLNMVEEYLTTDGSSDRGSRKVLLDYIHKKKKIRELMDTRDSCYKFYCRTKDRFPENAGEIYRKYKEAVEEIKKIKEN